MFSCCCGRVDFSWTPVCGCYTKGSNCSMSCLESTLQQDFTSYHKVSLEIYNRIRKQYPYSAIWITGHSLGGSLASLLALAINGPAIAFEAPGERLYAQRVGLFPWNKYPQPEWQQMMEDMPITHFINTRDPIPYGDCTGKFSICYYGGYAIESKCHLGKIATYDIGHAYKDILYHNIEYMLDVIRSFVIPPIGVVQWNCSDCSSWNFIE